MEMMSCGGQELEPQEYIGASPLQIGVSSACAVCAYEEFLS